MAYKPPKPQVFSVGLRIITEPSAKTITESRMRKIISELINPDRVPGCVSQIVMSDMIDMTESEKGKLCRAS